MDEAQHLPSIVIHFGPRPFLFSDGVGSPCDWIWTDASRTGTCMYNDVQHTGVARKSTRMYTIPSTDPRGIPTAWSKPLGLAVEPTDGDDALPLTLQHRMESLAEGDALVEMSENRGQIRGRLGMYLTLVRGSVCHGARWEYHGIIMVIDT